LAAFGLLQAVTAGFTGLAPAARELWAWPVSAQPLSTMLIEHAVVSAIPSAVALRYFYVSAQWRRQVETEADVCIRPHLLFNSGNTIAELTRTQPAEAAIEDLADLLRVSLTQRSLITLDDELGMVANYLRLEHQRLGERLRVESSFEDSLGEVALPPLTLQPLVENAVCHAIARLREGGCIAIEAQRVGDDSVAIGIRNTVPCGAPTSGGQRVAQDNVRQRLQLALGERAGMITATTSEGYSVRARLPAR